MAATPHRLKTSANDAQGHERRPDPLTANALEPAIEFDDNGEDIPIFCAGGCGEVIGYVKKGQSIPTSRCSACAVAETAEASLARTAAVSANTDELAELRSAPRDLRKLRVVQVVAVALIFAGSLFIAMGRPVGIYLAAFGTVAWISVAFVLSRRLRD
jgi:hypothetical protein